MFHSAAGELRPICRVEVDSYCPLASPPNWSDGRVFAFRTTADSNTHRIATAVAFAQLRRWRRSWSWPAPGAS
eukprot:2221165-Pleurochrysis_carterae.AAC.2